MRAYSKTKCHYRLYRARVKGALVWYCTVEDHDHGEGYPGRKRLTLESIAVDPEEFYASMVRKP